MLVLYSLIAKGKELIPAQNFNKQTNQFVQYKLLIILKELHIYIFSSAPFASQEMRFKIIGTNPVKEFCKQNQYQQHEQGYALVISHHYELGIQGPCLMKLVLS